MEKHNTIRMVSFKMM